MSEMIEKHLDESLEKTYYNLKRFEYKLYFYGFSRCSEY